MKFTRRSRASYYLLLQSPWQGVSEDKIGGEHLMQNALIFLEEGYKT